MNVITVPFFRDGMLMVKSYNNCYVLQSVAGMLYSGDAFLRRNEDVRKIEEKKVEPVIEINDGRLDLFA